jgi:hypothetical protein
MTITPKQAQAMANTITIYAAIIRPATIASEVANLLEQRDAAVWPMRGESAGSVSGGSYGDPTAARAANREYRAAIARLAAIENALASLQRDMEFISKVRTSLTHADLDEIKVRCGERTPHSIRRDEWYSGEVAACEALAEEWTRADGSTAVRTSGLCVTHRKQWDAEQRQRVTHDHG